MVGGVGAGIGGRVRCGLCRSCAEPRGAIDSRIRPGQAGQPRVANVAGLLREGAGPIVRAARDHAARAVPLFLDDGRPRRLSSGAGCRQVFRGDGPLRDRPAGSRSCLQDGAALAWCRIRSPGGRRRGARLVGGASHTRPKRPRASRTLDRRGIRLVVRSAVGRHAASRHPARRGGGAARRPSRAARLGRNRPAAQAILPTPAVESVEGDGARVVTATSER